MLGKPFRGTTFGTTLEPLISLFVIQDSRASTWGFQKQGEGVLLIRPDFCGGMQKGSCFEDYPRRDLSSGRFYDLQSLTEIGLSEKEKGSSQGPRGYSPP